MVYDWCTTISFHLNAPLLAGTFQKRTDRWWCVFPFSLHIFAAILVFLCLGLWHATCSIFHPPPSPPPPPPPPFFFWGVLCDYSKRPWSTHRRWWRRWSQPTIDSNHFQLLSFTFHGASATSSHVHFNQNNVTKTKTKKRIKFFYKNKQKNKQNRPAIVIFPKLNFHLFFKPMDRTRRPVRSNQNQPKPQQPKPSELIHSIKTIAFGV